MGKSTAAGFLQQLGWQVIDTDLLAREVVAPGQPALDELRDAFGTDILEADGTLRRDRLAEIVFADRDKRHRLEAIVHPRIRERWQATLRELNNRGATSAVVVIPLLFETNAGSAFHKVVCLACKTQTQLARLRARGWNDPQIRQRLAAQWPIERKMAAADLVVWSEGARELTLEQLRRVSVLV